MGGMYPPFGGVGLYGPYGSVSLYGSIVTYGSLNLTESSPPQSFTEPLDLLGVKTFLHFTAGDNDRNDEISSMITAAREQAEILQGRDLVRKQWDLSMDYWNAYRVELRDPLVSVDLVQFTNSDGVVTQMHEGADYLVDRAKHPGVLVPPYNSTWPIYTPRPSSSLLFRFTSGFAPDSAWWSDSGARVKMGMKQLISSWFTERLPFVKGPGTMEEYPFAVTSNLSYGALARSK